MYCYIRLLLLLLVFHINSSYANAKGQGQDVLEVGLGLRQKRVAIIGAGAAGSSVAYHLAQGVSPGAGMGISDIGIEQSQSPGPNPGPGPGPGYDITIYDTNHYIGGRSITLDKYLNDSNLPMVEIGASLFIEKNYYLMNASREFELELEKFDIEEKNKSIVSSIGIWGGGPKTPKEAVGPGSGSGSGSAASLEANGHSSPLMNTMPSSSFGGEAHGHGQWYYRSDWSLYQKTKYYFKYFRQFYRLRKLTASIIDDWFIPNFYQSSTKFPFLEINNTILQDEGQILINTTAYDYFHSIEKGYDDQFIMEFLDSLTRINYSQNINTINAMGAMITIAAAFNPTWKVHKGNYQIFEKYCERANATVELQSTVKKIEWIEKQDEGDGGCYELSIVGNEGVLKKEMFDYVVIATKGIDTIEMMTPKVSSSTTTTSTSTSTLASTPSVRPPYVVLYVYIIQTPTLIKPTYFNDEQPTTMIATLQTEALFYSINLVDYHNGNYIYKIFTPLQDLDLDLFFNEDYKLLLKKKWDAYPELTPVNNQFDQFEIAPKLWYVNTMEQLISTMETEVLAGANIAELIKLTS